MNKILSCLLILTIATSCREKPKPVTAKPQLHADTPAMQAQTNIKPQPAPVKDTIPAYTRSVYQQYITPQVQTLLSNLLPDWQLPDPTAWEKYWFHQYKSDTSLVNFARADFNGDQRADYAFILQSKKNKLGVWVLQSDGDAYRPSKLTEMETANAPIQMGLELRRQGSFDYTDADTGQAKTMTLQHPAITVLWFEASAETFYWSNNKYQSVFTGD